MHTHHAWVLLEKILSWDFWLLENLGCYISLYTIFTIADGMLTGTRCNTPGVCHQLSNGFKLNHGMLSGDGDVRSNI